MSGIEESHKMEWGEFEHTYIIDDWFALDRRKTLRAMRALWERIPADDLDKLPDRMTVFAPSANVVGQVLPDFRVDVVPRDDLKNPRSPRAFVYFAPQLENMPQSEVDFNVAHEFATVVLEHFKALGSADEAMADEIAEDELAARWGFTSIRGLGKAKTAG